ncbi:exocyst complex component 8-like [Centruroides sculpturatus]|uniref:exocyst complex component 8-like n=1 Tax=Centruroides sculpturatus TaxID=218467 RepID=UPI000C6DC263|nr:exocyst complex component 8-like [Centruroides sculpturatus]
MAVALANRLSSLTFNPHEYVKELNEVCEEVEDLLSARQRIVNVAEETNGQLKKNVYKNYTQFIETAKEISYLESEMYQLSHMLTEHQSVLNSLREISITGDKVSDATERNSEIKEEDGRKNLSTLLEKIEGCVSILEVQDRYLIHSGDIMELNTSDYTPIQRIHAILLNDVLVLASWLPMRRGPVQYKFHAMYELDNLAVVNVKEDPNLKNAFKVLMFPDTRLFQCDTAQMKKEWLALIEQTKKKKSSSANLKLDNIRSNSLNPFDDQEDLEETDPELPEWLLELPEDLDVCIAQRDFEEAVKLVKKAYGHFAAFPKNVSLKEMRIRIDQRKKNLVDILMKELHVSPDCSFQAGPRTARRAVSLLISLGKSSQACDLFLKHCTAILKHSMKQQKMDGATAPYIRRLCVIFFNNIIEAGKEFSGAFSNKNSCASAFVIWSVIQLQQFVQTFTRHVFTPQVALSAVSAECISLIRSHCEQLTDIGLDLSSLLDNLLQSDIERIIKESKDKLLEAINVRAVEDKWRKQNHQNKAGVMKFVDDMADLGITNVHNYVENECFVTLTTNTTAFSKAYLNFVDNLLKIYAPSVCNLISEALYVTFRAQLQHIENSIRDSRYSNDIIQVNMEFLLSTLLNFAKAQYKEKLNKDCSSLAKLQHELPRLLNLINSTNGKHVVKQSRHAYV